MLDAFKHLVESGMVSEEVESAIQEAFNKKIQENRDQVTAELREEFARKYDHDKKVMIESIDAMLSENLAAEIAEFVEDKKALAETRARYMKKMKSDAKVFEAFVANQLAKELVEFQTDRKAVSDKFRKLEEFVVNALAREISEFAEDKKDLAETKVKLVSQARTQLGELKSQFVKRAAKTVEETITNTLVHEISQLREDIDSARNNSFGRKIFEAFAHEYQNSFFSEKSDTAKLLKVVKQKDSKLAEAEVALKNAQKIIESKDSQIKNQKDLMERAKVMSELLAPLSADKQRIMKDLLESVQTNRLTNAFEKYLPAVMEGETRKPKASKVLSESAEVTGDRKDKTSEVGLDNIVDLRKLAGLN